MFDRHPLPLLASCVKETWGQSRSAPGAGWLPLVSSWKKRRFIVIGSRSG